MTDAEGYVPPKVWTWQKPNGGTFQNINRPTAGATHQKDLPRGNHPLQLYSMGTGNGRKVTIMLEELLAAGVQEAEYDAWMIDIGAGDQFESGYVELNPNSNIPALIDYSGPAPIKLFETGAILLHLAERFGRFIPQDPVGRAECLSWLFWQVGSAPFLPGGLGHFYKFAPIKIEYAINRYAMEVKRQLDVLNRRLRTGSSSWVTRSRSRTSPSSRGTAASSLTGATDLQSSSTAASTPTSSVALEPSSNVRQ